MSVCYTQKKHNTNKTWKKNSFCKNFYLPFSGRKIKKIKKKEGVSVGLSIYTIV